MFILVFKDQRLKVKSFGVWFGQSNLRVYGRKFDCFFVLATPLTLPLALTLSMTLTLCLSLTLSLALILSLGRTVGRTVGRYQHMMLLEHQTLLQEQQSPMSLMWQRGMLRLVSCSTCSWLSSNECCGQCNYYQQKSPLSDSGGLQTINALN